MMPHATVRGHLRRSAVRRAITMVELLVVLAVLGVLVALIVPGLSQTKKTADVTLCMTRLHGMATGVLAYGGDNRGRLPVGGRLEDPQPSLVAAVAGSYVENTTVLYCPVPLVPESAETPENLAAGRIGYFYYSCPTLPASTDVSPFLRRSGAYWPRELHTSLPPETWLASDRFFRSERTGHDHYWKGVSYVTLDGSTHFLADSPRSDFH